MCLSLAPTFLALGQVTIVETADPHYTQKQYVELKERALKGEIYAYDQYYHFGHCGDEKCLSLSIIMANKYNHPRAFYDAYYILTKLYEANNSPMDSLTAEYAIGLLKKGAELSNPNCCFELCRLYLSGEYVKQDTSMAKTYIYKEYHGDIESATRAWNNIKRCCYKEAVKTKTIEL